MYLYLIRHAEADSVRKKQIGRTFREPGSLTDKGRQNAAKLALFMKKKGATLDEIWHSTKLRAKQTADIIAKELGVKYPYKKEGLTPNDPVDKCLGKIEREGDINLAIVSHIPFIHKMASLLLTGTEDNFEKVSFIPTGAICFENINDQWKAVWSSGVTIGI